MVNEQLVFRKQEEQQGMETWLTQNDDHVYYVEMVALLLVGVYVCNLADLPSIVLARVLSKILN